MPTGLRATVRHDGHIHAPMLCFLGYGAKDFSFGSIPVMSRVNREVYVCLSGRLRTTGEAMGGESWRAAWSAAWIRPPLPAPGVNSTPG